MVEFLHLKSPKSYKVLLDTASGDYWQTIEIVVDKEYYNKTKKMIMGHKKFRDFGYNKDSLHIYTKLGFQVGAYSFEDEYFYDEHYNSSPRLKDKFIYFYTRLKKDSIITIVSRPL